MNCPSSHILLSIALTIALTSTSYIGAHTHSLLHHLSRRTLHCDHARLSPPAFGPLKARRTSLTLVYRIHNQWAMKTEDQPDDCRLHMYQTPKRSSARSRDIFNVSRSHDTKPRVLIHEDRLRHVLPHGCGCVAGR
jgi:hypothetical protein